MSNQIVKRENQGFIMPSEDEGPEQALAPVQPQTQLSARESREATDPFSLARFDGAGTLELTEREREILLAPLDPEEVEHDPPGDRQRRDGNGDPILYIPHAAARFRLMRAFGPGAWSLVPASPPAIRRLSDKMAVVYQTWDLMVRGKFVGRSTGECSWIPTNPKMTEGDAIEGAQSNALSRIVQKTLGVGLELFTSSGRDAMRQKLAGSQPSAPAPKPPVRKSASAPAAAPTPAPSSGTIPNPWIGKLVAHEQKNSPPTAAKKWTLWKVTGEDGTAFGTFSETIGPTLASAVDLYDGRVKIEWKLNKKGNREIVSINAHDEVELDPSASFEEDRNRAE